MNKAFGLSLSVISSVCLSFSAAAHAAQSGASVVSSAAPAASNVSSAQASAPDSTSLLDHFTAGYFAVYHGASLNDPGSSFTLDHNGFRNTSNAVYLDSVADLSYLLTKSIGVGAYVPFFIVPAPGQHFVMGDAGVQFFDRKTVDSDGLRVFTNVILQGPTSDYSQARGQTLAVKTTPYVMYDLPHTNFKLGSFTEAKAYLGVNSAKTFKLWAEPFVRYSLSESFALSLAYEMEADHFFGKPTLDFTSYQTDFQPGVIWWITRKIMVNPYVQIFTGNKVALDNSAVGAVVSARLQ